MKYEIEYIGKKIIIEKSSNGKFKKPSIAEFCKSGRSVTWLDDTRIPLYGVEEHRTEAKSGLGKNVYGKYDNVPKEITDLPRYDDQGRFPANLLVSDDVLNDGRERKSGKDCIRRQEGYFLEHRYGDKDVEQITYGDSGSFSRYFDLNAWWHDRVKKLPKEVQKVFPFLIVPKPPKSEKDRGCEMLSDKPIPYSDYRKNYDTTKSYVSEYPDGKPRPMNKMKNIHPTCKSIQLMSYLITLASREGDIVLDPFVGSGTTCISARMLSRKYIGIEINPEYIKIAKARLKMVCNINEWL